MIKEKSIWTFQFNYFIKYFLLTMVIYLIALLLHDFYYIMIFDIAFIVLKLHYQNNFYQSMIRYYWLYILILTLVPKILLLLDINQMFIVILSLLIVILFVNEVHIENQRKDFEMVKSTNYRKNLMAFMMLIVIFAMSVDNIKIAQMMTFAFGMNFMDFILIRYIVNDKNK